MTTETKESIHRIEYPSLEILPTICDDFRDIEEELRGNGHPDFSFIGADIVCGGQYVSVVWKEGGDFLLLNIPAYHTVTRKVGNTTLEYFDESPAGLRDPYDIEDDWLMGDGIQIPSFVFQNQKEI